MKTKTILFVLTVVILLFVFCYIINVVNNQRYVKGKFTDFSDMQGCVNVKIDDEWFYFYNGYKFDFTKLEFNKTYNWFYENIIVNKDTHTNEYHLIEVRDGCGTQPIGFRIVD